MVSTVLLVTRDLLFRSKLAAIVAGAGGRVTADAAACGLAVVEVESPGWEERIRELGAQGTPVLAFGSHVKADLLRLARGLGAEAVPNSEVASRLRDLLTM